jgi:hypothetical protein
LAGLHLQMYMSPNLYKKKTMLQANVAQHI